MFVDEDPEGRADEDALARQLGKDADLALERVSEIMDETAVRRDFAALAQVFAAIRREMTLITDGKVTASKTKRLALARHLMIITPRWRDLVSLRETALGLVGETDAPIIDRLYKDVRQAFWGMVMTYDVAVNHDQWGRLGGVITQVRRLYQAANELAQRVDAAAQRFANEIPKPSHWQSGHGAAEARLKCALVQTTAVGLTSAIVNLLLTLKPPEPADDASKAYARNSANVMRMRERRRRGVVSQVPVSLYRDDVAILRTLGFLPPGEPTREQQTTAVEAFMMSAILSRTDLGLTWAMREDSQAGRLKGLGAPEEGDD